ncbi:MAG: hypothetical protein K2Z81_20225, partial [Cyanobacteria bacterium]|nr:hypothetical protein [Cyanobacteriota bacterium]
MVVSGFAYFLTGAIRQFAVSDSSTALSFIVNNIEANYKSELKTIDQIASLHGFSPYDEQEARGNEFANLSADEAAILVGMHLSYLKRSELFPPPPLHVHDVRTSTAIPSK